MEGLGNEFNFAPAVNNIGVSLKIYEGVTFICSNADTFTLTCSDSLNGVYASPGAVITKKYTNTSTNGTAAWVRTTQTAANTVVISSGAAAFWVDASLLPPGKVYVKMAQSSAGRIAAIFSGLKFRAAPNFLPILSS